MLPVIGSLCDLYCAAQNGTPDLLVPSSLHDGGYLYDQLVQQSPGVIQGQGKGDGRNQPLPLLLKSGNIGQFSLRPGLPVMQISDNFLLEKPVPAVGIGQGSGSQLSASFIEMGPVILGISVAVYEQLIKIAKVLIDNFCSLRYYLGIPVTASVSLSSAP